MVTCPEVTTECPTSECGPIVSPTTDSEENCPQNNTVFIPTTVVVPTTIPIIVALTTVAIPTTVAVTKVAVAPTTVTILSTVWSACSQYSAITPTTTTNKAPTITLDTTTVTTSESCHQPAMTGGSSSSASTALGILLGIFMVLLVLVTIGWVWTCWSMKRQGGMKITSRKAM